MPIICNDSLQKVVDCINSLCDETAASVSYEFDNFLSLEQFKKRMVFELFNQLLSYSAERKSIRNHIGTTYDTDNNIRRANRSLSVLIEQTQKDRQRLCVSERDPYLSRVTAMPSQRSGRSLSQQDMLAIDNSRLLIVRRLTNLRVGENGELVRKISGKEFYNAYTEYFAYLRESSNEAEPKIWLDKLFYIANLETNIPVGLLYSLSKYMYENGENDLPPASQLLCNQFPISVEPYILGNNRFLLERIDWIHDCFKMDFIQFYQRLSKILLSHQIVYKQMLQNKEFIDSAIKVPLTDIRAYLSETYNLFTHFSFELPPEKFSAKQVKLLNYIAKELFYHSVNQG